MKPAARGCWEAQDQKGCPGTVIAAINTVGLVALAPIGRGLSRVSLEELSTEPVRAAVMVKNKILNLAEPTGKCSNIIVYMFIVNLPLISP